MNPRRVRIAMLLAFICHGFFVLTARYRLSYDAYTHILFANHYAEDWFSLWETRWYTGFPVVSYPPLTHQLIALFVPFLGFDRAFALILWVVTSVYPLGVYAFCRIFTGKTSASYAALASAVLLPIYVTAHIFGQLPFLTSTLTALLAAASFSRYLREDGLHNFALSVGLVTTSMAMHHATLMVQPFLVFAVILNHLFLQQNRERKFLGSLIQRVVAFGVTSVVTSSLVIFPFWQWGLAQAMQTPIDHLSRHNFFTSPLAFAIFFFPLYGPLVGLIPFLFRKWHARFTGLLVSFSILFLLGLGGTTPLPKIFFGRSWAWLTYDRFAFWGCLTLTPFFGILFIRLRHSWKNRFVFQPIPTPFRRNFLFALLFSVFAITTLGAWFTPLLFPFQPKPIPMQPIVDFLNRGDHSHWRYVTFGFGDQFAYLNLLTTATTIDGSYHTARTLPELKESGVGQVDTAYWALNGISLIKPILQNSGEHSVRWGFVNPKTVEAAGNGEDITFQSPFVPLLDELGWQKIKTLENGIWVYENPNAVSLVDTTTPAFPAFTSFAWGVFPMLSLVTASALGALRLYPVQAQWILRKIHAFAVGLLPIALCFWVFRTAGDFSHPRVYFTYDNALFFVSDALVLLAVILWLTTRISNRSNRVEKHTFAPAYLSFFVVAFLLLMSVSVLSSQDWRTALYISIHFWLVTLFILSLRDWQESWTVATYGLCAALAIQLIIGFAEFHLQSTEFLNSMDLQWPGNLDPSRPGASVVQLANGWRILRAYGTLPHPNILGGLALFTLLGPTSLFLSSRKLSLPALILSSLGLILLTLTFSRSAWLGSIAFILIIVLKMKDLNYGRVIVLVLAGVITMALTLYPLKDLFFTRVTNQAIATEHISSVGRSWLTGQALHMIQEHPVTGVGIGSFILRLARTAEEGAPIEPVHNILLLVTAELGVPGLILFVAIVLSVGMTIIKAKSPNAIVAGAIVAALGVISLFDHYLWTLAPGRVMLGLALGLWAGQVTQNA